MVNKWLVLVSFMILCISGTLAQGDARIQEVNFEGLKKNKLPYLQNIVEVTEGDVIDFESISNDVQQLKNSVGIADASFRVDTLNSDVTLTYVTEEKKTLLPIAKFGGIRDNIWLQLGFVDINWLGTGQTLTAHYQNSDGRHSGLVFYRVPNVQNTAWGYSVSLSKWSSREPLFFPEGTVFYDYDNNSLALTGIRNLNKQNFVEVGATYFVETYSISEEQEIMELNGPNLIRQPKFLFKLEYQLDKLDYHFFYINGTHWTSAFQNVLNTVDNTWFHSIEFQGRKFWRLGEKGNLASRFRFALSTNNDSPFAPFVADSHINLRGVGNRIDRGTAQIILNLEHRYTILEKKEWAAQAVVFADLGTWRNPGGELRDVLDPNQFRQFIGAGFRIIKNRITGATLRVDYGIDIFNTEQRGFVIGLGQYF